MNELATIPVTYDYRLVTLSFVIAALAFFVALALAGRVTANWGTNNKERGWKIKSATAVVAGLTISTVDYTGMAALSLVPNGVKPDRIHSVDISVLASSINVTVVFAILGFVLMTVLLLRRLLAQRVWLENERKLLRGLINNIPDLVYAKDLHGRFVIANAKLARAVGVDSPGKVLGKTDYDFYPTAIADAFRADEQQVLRSSQPLFNREEEFVDRAGNKSYLLTTKVPLQDDHGQIVGIVGVGRDISSRKKAEEALRWAHRGAEVFINAVPSILIGIDLTSHITRWNSAAVNVFRLSADEVAGKKLADCGIKWLRPGMADEIQSWSAGRSPRRSDQVPFERDGQIRLLGLTVTPVAMTADNLTEVLVIGSDTTDRNALEEQLRQAQKLESVGQLAAGVAHEINTPTQYIGDNVHFLKDAFEELKILLESYETCFLAAQANSLSAETIQQVATAIERIDKAFLLEEIPKAIEQTLEGVARVATLVGAMKEFSHPGTKEKVPLDLNRAIASTITVSRNEWKYVAELETEFDSSLPFISCLPSEFNQVILNLIVNAAHAIAGVVEKGGPPKGMIRVQTRDCPDWAEIRIEDTGGGIPDSVQPRIFDPFFTTKAIGKGTGQGLAIARSVVVDKHRGTIHFETEAGKGTTFVIRLPHDGGALASSAATA